MEESGAYRVKIMCSHMTEYIPDPTQSIEHEVSAIEKPYTAKYQSNGDQHWKSVTVKPIGIIGEGNFGQVIDAVVDFNGRKRLFVIKRIKDDSSENIGLSEREIQLYGGLRHKDVIKRVKLDRKATLIGKEESNYLTAKETGLKVFPTCRSIYSSRHGPELLMTRGYSKDWICLGDKGENSLLSFFGMAKISEILNYNIFVDRFLQQAKLGYKSGTLVAADAYFFLVNLQTNGKIDFVVGDVGTLSGDDGRRNSLEIWLENLNYIKMAVSNFLQKNVSSEKVDEYLEILEKKCQETINKNNINKRAIKTQELIWTLKYILIGK